MTTTTNAAGLTVGQQIEQILGIDSSAASAAKTDTADSTEDRFLKLLVAQMRNQDPLSPLDNAQVTTQLAQISTVRGVESLNQSLNRLISQIGVTSPLDALGVVGRQVLVAGDGFERLSEADGAVRAGFELASAADEVRLRIVNEDGVEMYSRTLGKTAAGMQLFEWNGKGADGKDAPAGTYRIEVAASAGGTAVAATALAPIRVLGISPGADGVRIELAGQRVLSAQDIKAIL